MFVYMPTVRTDLESRSSSLVNWVLPLRIAVSPGQQGVRLAKRSFAWESFRRPTVQAVDTPDFGLTGSVGWRTLLFAAFSADFIQNICQTDGTCVPTAV